MRACPGTMTIEDINYDLRRDFILLMLDRGIKIKDDYKDGQGIKSSKTIDGDWFIKLCNGGIKAEGGGIGDERGTMATTRYECVSDYQKRLKKFIRRKRGKVMHVRKFPQMEEQELGRDPGDWFDVGKSIYKITSRLFI